MLISSNAAHQLASQSAWASVASAKCLIQQRKSKSICKGSAKGSSDHSSGLLKLVLMKRLLRSIVVLHGLADLGGQFRSLFLRDHDGVAAGVAAADLSGQQLRVENRNCLLLVAHLIIVIKNKWH